METPAFTDTATARSALNAVRDDLAAAEETADAASKALRRGILEARPAGVLTVDQMAAAMGRSRNYVDSIWSSHGGDLKKAMKQKGDIHKQTRVMTVEATEEERRDAALHLSNLYRDFRSSLSAVTAARSLRDRVTALVYASRLQGLGPSAIGREVGVDRNHVLRVSRTAGIGPQYRTGSQNQHTASNPKQHATKG